MPRNVRKDREIYGLSRKPRSAVLQRERRRFYNGNVGCFNGDAYQINPLSVKEESERTAQTMAGSAAVQGLAIALTRPIRATSMSPRRCCWRATWSCRDNRRLPAMRDECCALALMRMFNAVLTLLRGLHQASTLAGVQENSTQGVRL